MPRKFQFTALAVILVLIGMFAWWWWRADQIALAPARYAAALEAEGWEARHGEVGVTGAPSRLDMTIAEPMLRTGDGRWGWSAERVTMRGFTYRDDYVSATAPVRHRLETPHGVTEVDVRRAEASLIFGEDGYAPDELARLSAVVEGFESASGGRIAASRLEVYLRAPPVSVLETRRFFVAASDLEIGSARAVDVTLEGEAIFDRLLDRGKSGIGVAEVVSMDLRPGLLVRWGDGERRSALRIGGARLTRNSGSDPLAGWRGKLAFESDQAREALSLLHRMGLLDRASRDRLLERVSEKGRLAGVLEIDRGAVTISDVGPEPITISGP